MMVVRKICIELKRPVFEVMRWPASELEYWSLFFSIGDNEHYTPPPKTPDTITLEESKRAFRELMG